MNMIVKGILAVVVISSLSACASVQGFGRGVRDVGVAAVTPAPVVVNPYPVYRPGPVYWRDRYYRGRYHRGGRYGRRW